MELKIILGDITELEVDAIISANLSLYGCRPIEDSRRMPATGEAVIKKVIYELPIKYIIYTIGPIYNPKKEQLKLLANCYRNSLDLAEEHKLKSIAFPSISVETFGYLEKKAAQVVRRIMEGYNFKNLNKVILCMYRQEDKEIMDKAFKGFKF